MQGVQVPDAGFAYRREVGQTLRQCDHAQGGKGQSGQNTVARPKPFAMIGYYRPLDDNCWLLCLVVMPIVRPTRQTVFISMGKVIWHIDSAFALHG